MRAKKKSEITEVPPTASLPRLRAAPAPPVRTVKRVFTLDHPDGEVVVTIKGPAGAAKLVSSHTSISISTDGEPQEVAARARPARTVAPARPLSGNPHEPGGTINEYLPGDDQGDAAKALGPDALEFLTSMEKAEMRRASQE